MMFRTQDDKKKVMDRLAWVYNHGELEVGTWFGEFPDMEGEPDDNDQVGEVKPYCALAHALIAVGVTPLEVWRAEHMPDQNFGDLCWNYFGMDMGEVEQFTTSFDRKTNGCGCSDESYEFAMKYFLEAPVEKKEPVKVSVANKPKVRDTVLV